MAKVNPAMMANGANSQTIKTIRPKVTTKTCKKNPKIIRTILIMAPKIRETVLEIKVLKNSFKSNALGYLHLYLLQGAKKVLKSRPTEKKFAAKVK